MVFLVGFFAIGICHLFHMAMTILGFPMAGHGSVQAVTGPSWSQVTVLVDSLREPNPDAVAFDQPG